MCCTCWRWLTSEVLADGSPLRCWRWLHVLYLLAATFICPMRLLSVRTCVERSFCRVDAAADDAECADESVFLLGTMYLGIPLKNQAPERFHSCNERSPECRSKQGYAQVATDDEGHCLKITCTCANDAKFKHITY